MTKSRRTFAVHPGETLGREFMEPMGMSAYALEPCNTRAMFHDVSFDAVHDYERERGQDQFAGICDPDQAVRAGKMIGAR